MSLSEDSLQDIEVSDIRNKCEIKLPAHNDKEEEEEEDDEISFYLQKQDQECMSTLHIIKTVFGSSIGNLLEWFDFAMFGLLADEIGHNFFPPNNSGIQVIESFAVFAGAFFMRPLGGAMFGYIGDKYGRITSLRLSLFMMAIPTFLTGCLPKYEKIGAFAPICLCIFRLVQGLSVGGEFTGAITYILEVAPSNRKALYITMVHVSGTGTLLGSVVVGTMRAVFTKEQMMNWAWRIPFLCGVIVAGFGVWMRTGMKASAEFERNRDEGKLLKNPTKTVLKNHKKTIFTIVCHLMFLAAWYYLIFIWLPEYMYNKDTNSVKSIYIINAINMIIHLGFVMLSGYIVDQYLASEPTKSLITWGIITCIYGLIVFPLLSDIGTVGIFFVQMIWAFVGGMYHGGWSLWGIERFKDESVLRYSGFGIAYNISLAFFGGTAPLLASALVLENETWTLGLVLCLYGAISVTTNIVCYYCDMKRKNEYDSSAIGRELDLHSVNNSD